MVRCGECSAKNGKGRKFCHACGAPVGKAKTKKKSATSPKESAAAMPPGTGGGGTQIPQNFPSLLKLIVKRTLATFFRRLPLTVGFGVATWLLHLFLLVVINDGFNKTSWARPFLYLGGSRLSGMVFWTVASALVAGFIVQYRRRDRDRPFFEQVAAKLRGRIAALKLYFKEAKMDALAVLAAGAGTAMVIGTLVNGSTNFALAVGFGALLASRAGSVFALLFRSAWTTAFGLFRGVKIRQYGMAAGYTGMAASFLGFAINWVVAPMGFVLGVLALIGAFVVAVQNKGAGATGALLALAGGAVAFALFGDAGILLADDGGFREYGWSPSRWISSSGSITTIMLGIPPAIGAGIGAALGPALSDLGDLFPDDWFDPPPEDEDSGDNSPPEPEPEPEPEPDPDDETVAPPERTSEPDEEQVPGPELTPDSEGEPVPGPEKTTKTEEEQVSAPDRPPALEEEPVPAPEHTPEGAAQQAETPPEEKPGFFGSIWNRVSDGVTGAGTEIIRAGQDVYRDPSILWDTGANIGGEIYDTGAAAVDLGERAVTATIEAGRDVVNNPEIIIETITGTGSDLVDGAGALATGAVNVATDVAQAAKDTYDNPELIGDTLLGMGEDISSGAETVGEVLSDPDKVLDGVQMLTGVENFENSLDPNRSLPERIGQVGLGVLGVYGTITGAQSIAQSARAGATNLIGRVTAAGGNLVDDAARIAAGTIDDATRVAAGQADDAVRGAAGAAGISDDTARAGAGVATGSTDDAVRGAAGAGVTDDTARAGAGAADEVGSGAAGAGVTDDTARAGAGAADDAGRPRFTPEEAQARQDYGNHLENRGARPDSTLRPGDPSDFSHADDIVPDTSGYTNVSERNVQMVADNHGVTIHTRPTNPYARELLENGDALAKPEMVKTKSLTEIDMHLIPDEMVPGGDPNNLVGRVGSFDPVMPPQGDMSDDLYRAVQDRHGQRAQEWIDQQRNFEKYADHISRDGVLVVDNASGLPFTGDVDGFAIRGMHGETLPQAVVEQVQRELMQGPGDVMHGFHTEWNYSGVSREISEEAVEHAALTGGTAQSPFQTAAGIDGKIRGSHAPGGEALNSYTAQPGMQAPNPTASYWRGGTTNPLITDP